MSGSGQLVRAAGVVPVRRTSEGLQVALVHRPKYDDWSWPKGKLDPGEDDACAAVRETWEETGLQVRLGEPLPEVRYLLRGGSPKRVRYWIAVVTGGHGRLEHEVDAVRWLSPKQAAKRLTYAHDRELVDQVVRRSSGDLLDTWPLLVVRHAHALPRGDWKGPDGQRPLSSTGQEWARGGLTSVLTAYSPEVLLSSPSLRCTDTVLPYSATSGVQTETRKGLSEEGYAADPTKVDKLLGKVLDRAAPVALCTHGPVLPQVLTRLADLPHAELGKSERTVLRRLRDDPMDKGEVLVATMLGTGQDARVLAVQRHRPA